MWAKVPYFHTLKFRTISYNPSIGAPSVSADVSNRRLIVRHALANAAYVAGLLRGGQRPLEGGKGLALLVRRQVIGL